MKIETKICLDEIDASMDALEITKGKKKLSKTGASKHRGWIKKHKAILKELKYKGKIRRLKVK